MDSNSRDCTICSCGLFGCIYYSDSPVATCNHNNLLFCVPNGGTRQNRDKGFEKTTRILATHNAFVRGLDVKAEFATPLNQSLGWLETTATTYQYDSLGNIRKITNALNYPTTFTYSDSWANTTPNSIKNRRLGS